MKTCSWLLVLWSYRVATNSQELDPELGIKHSASSPPTQSLQPSYQKSHDETGFRTMTRSERLISHLPDTNRHSACLMSCRRLLCRLPPDIVSFWTTRVQPPSASLPLIWRLFVADPQEKLFANGNHGCNPVVWTGNEVFWGFFYPSICSSLFSLTTQTVLALTCPLHLILGWWFTKCQNMRIFGINTWLM